MAEDESKDFFISYNKADRSWAEWIAFELEAAHYTTIIQAWDMRPGSNFVAEMDEAAKRAERTIPVLSPAYLTSDYVFAEWAAAFRHDPKGKQRKVLPVRIEPCVVDGLLGPIVYIDLVDLDESQAREQLLAGVKQGRAKPTSVSFPGSSAHSVPPDHPAFPGSLPQRQDVLSPQKSLATGREEKTGTRPMGHEQVWNVPYSRNPVFTGRELLMVKLAEALHTDEVAALTQPQAISDIGGIGKTQIALEYAYRFRGDYQAVLWVQADTSENITSSYLALAALLNLPEKDEQESARVVVAVKNWLQRATNWLLILDNADELTLARDFLPPSRDGHVLLTTRAHPTVRFARRVEVDTLSTEVGALFLLRRSGLLAPDALFEQASKDERKVAYVLSEELGGLPLALDQAGAYIEETGCSLVEYEHLFCHRRADLLAERGELLVNDHPDPVATTWSLSFEKVEQKSPAAADLLRLCACLAPDAIPETIVVQGAKYLGEHLAPVGEDLYLLNQVIEVLQAYSLLSREVRPAYSYLSVHRQVQAVLKDQMREQEQRQWTERTLRAVEAALPVVERGTWAQWDQILPQALHCQELIEQDPLLGAEATRLLHQTGWYLTERIRYREAEPLLKQALAITEQRKGLDHLDVARYSFTLAYLYKVQGKYAQAEPVYVRALAIFEQQLGAENPNTALCLNNLALLYKNQGKYAQAEPMYVRALAISEQQLGAQHPQTQIVRANYASLLQIMGRDAEGG